MTHYGILVPADLTAEQRVVTWEDRPDGGGLLALLYREIGDNLDAATVVPARGPIPGGLRLWCQDDVLLRADPEHNDRAIAVCRHFGYDVADLAGPIVFIGCPGGDDEAGLHPAVRAWLDDGLYRMRPVIDEPVEG
jgi:hypothetical protein